MRDVGEAGSPSELLIVAGEASGDLHAGNLLRALRERAPGFRAVGIGGDRMAHAGAELLYHYRHLAVVGITEVITHLRDVRRAMRQIVDAARERPIAAVVLVDYPDFNMVLARRLRKIRPQLPIVYYISPQVWAWRRGRVNKLARLVDSMLVILPFEKALYDEAGVACEFVGHPLLDAVPVTGTRARFAERHGVDPERVWVGLLPGSRRSEVQRLLAPMLASAARLASADRYEFLVPVSDALDPRLYEQMLAGLPASTRARVHLVRDDYYDLLQHSRAAVVCSGTATLEAALLDTPEVVVYRTSWLTYNLGKLLVHIRDIALANVVAGRRGVPELLQGEVHPQAILRELVPLLEDGPERQRSLEFLRQVRSHLGEPGASARAAAAVLRVAGHADVATELTAR